MRVALLALIVLLLAACTSTHKAGPPPSSPRYSISYSNGPVRSDATVPSGEIHPPAGDWPTYHGDVARTGRSATFPTPTALRIAANVKLDGEVYASPIVASGITVVATSRTASTAWTTTAISGGEPRWARRRAVATCRAATSIRPGSPAPRCTAAASCTSPPNTAIRCGTS